MATEQETKLQTELLSCSLSRIALMVKADWRNPYFGAIPYIAAMTTLHDMDDVYYADDAPSIVRYFLANAGTWRGDVARAVKRELNLRLKGA